MKVRKTQIKVRKNLPPPPWRFLISSVESQSRPTLSSPICQVSKNAPALEKQISKAGNLGFLPWKGYFPPLESLFSTLGNAILAERAHDSFLRTL